MSALNVNQSFSRIKRELKVDSVHAASIATSAMAQNGVTEHIVVGYAPAAFATAAAASVVSLRPAPGAVDAAAAANCIQIPAGAVVQWCKVDNHGTAVVGGTDFDVGLSATVDTTSAGLLDGALLASVNAGVLGAHVDAVTGIVANAADRFVTVTVNTTDNTAGDLRVVLKYITV